jgi:hypothetical protein
MNGIGTPNNKSKIDRIANLLSRNIEARIP